ncbi:hypothetical protein EJ02DRAFT_469724 [Clathrospora elynae]|uniref:Uncharacterized protein n=1 Tax=Clathrospora elynae TaxID=706981 RepID=A0A6A5SBQ0_9PLEO|nr:hypothetical protein EJ02DRAFT_469724 [Clathrospora elynae]
MTTRVSIIREELRTALKPMLEQATTTSITHNEERPQCRSSCAQQANAPITAGEEPNRASVAVDDEQYKDYSLRVIQGDDRLDFDVLGPSSSERYCPVFIYRQRWFQNWKIGSLEVESPHIHRRRNNSPHSDSSVNIQAHFVSHGTLWPSRCLCLSTAPNSQGNYHLAPMIIFIPIIKKIHPVINMIWSGDLERLQTMLESGFIISTITVPCMGDGTYRKYHT